LTNALFALANYPVGTAGPLALVSLPIHYFLPIEWSQLFAAVILSLLGGVYICFASVDGRFEKLILETAVVIVFALFAMISLKLNPLSSP
jgi:hypothetical protein